MKCTFYCFVVFFCRLVRRIYQLTMKAKRPYQICCILKEEKVEIDCGTGNSARIIWRWNGAWRGGSCACADGGESI